MKNKLSIYRTNGLTISRIVRGPFVRYPLSRMYGNRSRKLSIFNSSKTDRYYKNILSYANKFEMGGRIEGLTQQHIITYADNVRDVFEKAICINTFHTRALSDYK